MLTESDYLAFIENMHGENRLPFLINNQIATSISVFIGYRLADWNLRLLLRRLYDISWGILVLKPPGDDELARRQRDYLNQYYAVRMQLNVYWGTAREFAFELRERWEKFCKA